MQKKVFLDGEADAWYRRNSVSIADRDRHVSDPIMTEFERFGIRARNVLEIGCSNGWRLNALKNTWTNCNAYGIDPSSEAVSNSKNDYPGINCQVGTADALPYADSTFDLVIFGFCLYLVDRNDLFRIAAEADRVLCDGGILTILDFYSEIPYKNRYTHKENMLSFKMDYSRMFTWNPAYRLYSNRVMDHNGSGFGDPDNNISVTILKKDIKNSFPFNPFI
jgi:ubiquinone/menaquinone biosynthesis C-methylase UbiE